MLGWLGAATAAGCVHTAPVAPLVADPEQPLRLGWRWVAGARMTFRTVITRYVGSVGYTRAEDWTYVATDLDPSGVIHLEGKLVGLGTQVTADGHDVDARRLDAARAVAARQTPEEVFLDLRLSGRIVACSLADFAQALPHRLMAVHFPAAGVRPGDTWPDPGLARAFAPVLPLDQDVRTSTQATLSDVASADAGLRCTLAHTAQLQVGAIGPAIEVVATTTWDTDPGALTRRSVEARWRPDVGADGRAIGTLTAELSRLDGP
ncbi:MAG: hypothetical protein H6733_01795 [Alphaproteobacteria bacterium]|nr:hypothetical protein [Alphaproteobacteria bacterium]